MDLSRPTMATLFAQLGLNNDSGDIRQFIESNRGLASNIRLADANFWNPSQSAFIDEAIELDSEWSEVVDELDNLLRRG